MPSFTDNQGRAWRLDLNITAIKRVKSLTDVDLLGDDYADTLVELGQDIVKLVDVLYAIAKPQADALEITDESFGEGLFGDSINDATNAFITSLVEFFPSEKKRRAFRAIWQKTQIAIETGETELIKVIESEEMARMQTATIDKMKSDLWQIVGGSTSGGKSTSSPES